jgi:hypothetical protein
MCAFIQLKVQQQSGFLVLRKPLIQNTLLFIKRVRGLGAHGFRLWDTVRASTMLADYDERFH